MVQKAPQKTSLNSGEPSGPRVVIDGAQAIGQIPVDVEDIGCDYYIGSGHKWLCGILNLPVVHV